MQAAIPGTSRAAGFEHARRARPYNGGGQTRSPGGAPPAGAPVRPLTRTTPENPAGRVRDGRAGCAAAAVGTTPDDRAAGAARRPALPLRPGPGPPRTLARRARDRGPRGGDVPAP